MLLEPWFGRSCMKLAATSDSAPVWAGWVNRLTDRNMHRGRSPETFEG